MGCHAGEFIQHLDAGIVGTGGDLVGLPRMPAERRVQLLPQALPGHIGLAAAALLAGAAVKHHRAGLAALLQIALHRGSCRQGACAQKIVAAAVAVPAGNQGIRAALPCFLAQAGEGVILGQNADDGLALPEAAAEGGVDVAQLLRHLKAQLTQGIAVERCSLELFQG